MRISDRSSDVCSSDLHAPFRAYPRLQFAARRAFPATVPALLVFPLLGIANTRLGLDVVEPGVFEAFSVGPHILASDRAGMASDAFIEIQHHADLRADFLSAS